MRQLLIGQDFYRKEHKDHFNDAVAVNTLFTRAMTFIDKYFTLPKTMSIILKPMNGVHGYWLENIKTMYIDPRLRSKNRNLGVQLSCLIHEAAHAEQCYNGTLTFKEDGVYWCGKKYCTVISDLSYEEYMNLPWEVDARLKQDSFVALLAQDIIEHSKK